MEHGERMYREIYKTVDFCPTTALWCENGYLYTPDKKVFDALQIIFETVGFGNGIVTGYFDKSEDERDECVDGLSGHYYIDIA